MNLLIGRCTILFAIALSGRNKPERHSAYSVGSPERAKEYLLKILIHINNSAKDRDLCFANKGITKN